MADKERESIGENNSNDLTVKINVDVSEALTGLKAVERQARAAKRAVAELGEKQSKEIAFEDLTFPKYTAVKVYGKGGLYAEYISSLASYFGKNHAPDIEDDRLTSEEGIRNYASQYLVMLNERRISDYSTKELADELANREGIEEYVIEPHKEAALHIVREKNVSGSIRQIVGPARIVVNQD